MAPRFIGVKEVAEMLGEPEQYVYNLRHRGAGPRATRLGRKLKFEVGEVERWLQSRTEPEREAKAAV